MSRIIKFRAWCSIHKKMHFDVDIVEGSPTVNDYSADEDGFHSIRAMQFTGLLDKNGKEIFEGDILEFSEGHQVVSNRHFENNRIVCLDENMQWAFFYPDKTQQGGGYTFCKKNLETLTSVIGNIYENPELLNQ